MGIAKRFNLRYGDTISSALTYLLNARTKHGLWQDFHTLAGYSDEWVTAYVATQLASIDNDQANDAARLALSRLCKRRWLFKGWGYNARVPYDIDSTAWVLKLANSLNVNDAKLTKARKLINKSVLVNGGLPTFPIAGPIRHFTRLNHRQSFSGWCRDHPCVTAIALPLLNDDSKSRKYLRSIQADDGSWPAYWWVDREYSTTVTITALSQSQDTLDRNCIEQALSWLSARVNMFGSLTTPLHVKGSAFASALCLSGLQYTQDETNQKLKQQLGDWLIQQQRFDGSWLPSAELRIPYPDEQEPDERHRWTRYGKGGGAILNDCNAVFTTATVLHALNQQNQAIK